MDRRSYLLEDTKGFDTGNADEAFRYYLGGGGFAPPADADTPWARKWGLKLALEDLRRVVKQAGRGGRKVILGGHSLGASEAVAYAAWDFKGKPGWKDLDGLVLIDGGLRGTFDEADFEQAEAAAGGDRGRLAVARPARRRRAVGGRDPARRRRPLRDGLARRAVARAGLRAPARRVQAAVPGDERGAARLRLRPRHEPGRAPAPAHQRRHARDVRRRARLGRRRRHAGRAAGRRSRRGRP